jgi:cation diffusion facilitator CzcD-associated flavoprotein CzcO
MVLDPAGRWLEGWRSRFASHRIDRLRSAAVHHPHPDPHELRAHAIDGDRLDELHHPYDLPSTTLFDDFCDRLIFGADLDALVRRTRACAIRPQARGAVVELEDGSAIAARRVVIATNPVQRTMPPEASDRTDRRIRHGDDVDLRRCRHLHDRPIDVVGGGLTAVQLAVGAAGAGARVRLISRRPLVERQFDVNPGWLGPRELDHYRRCSHERRRVLIDQARGGGSVPAGDLERLARSPVEHLIDAEAVAFALAGAAEEIWFPTGHRLDATTDPLLAQLRTAAPTPIHDGLPCLDEDLRWPGTDVHLMGGYAALTLGPAARNLWGARWAAGRIADSIRTQTNEPPVQEDTP